MFCLDSIAAFKELELNPKETVTPKKDIFGNVKKVDEGTRLQVLLDMLAPKQPSKASNEKEPSPAKMAKPSPPPSPSFSLGNVHKRLFKAPIVNAHNAEADALALLKCCQNYGRDFIDFLIFTKNKFLY